MQGVRGGSSSGASGGVGASGEGGSAAARQIEYNRPEPKKQVSEEGSK